MSITDRDAFILKGFVRRYGQKLLESEIEKITDMNETSLSRHDIKDDDVTTVIDTSTQKYKILLEIINNILANSGKEHVDNLCEFSIRKNTLINEKNMSMFSEYEEKLFEYFDKTKCGWYKKRHVKNYIITFLKSALKDIGLKLISIEKSTHKNNEIVRYVMYKIK